MINDRSDRQKKNAAWELIQYLVDTPQQIERATNGGFLPTISSLYDDPALAEAAPIIRIGREAVQAARVRPVSPFYMQMSPRIARAFHRVLKGDIDGAKAVRSLQQEMQTILRRNR